MKTDTVPNDATCRPSVVDGSHVTAHNTVTSQHMPAVASGSQRVTHPHVKKTWTSEDDKTDINTGSFGLPVIK